MWTAFYGFSILNRHSPRVCYVPTWRIQDEFDIEEGTLLVMDCGYHNKKLLKAIRDEGLDYLVAVKRNSKVYSEIEHSIRDLWSELRQEHHLNALITGRFLIGSQ